MTTELTFETAISIGAELMDDWIELEPLFADVGQLVQCACCGKMVYDNDKNTHEETIWETSYYLGRVSGKVIDRIEYTCDYNTCYKIRATETLVSWLKTQKVDVEAALNGLLKDFKRAMILCRKEDAEIDKSTLNIINALRFWVKWGDAIINGERDLETLEYMRLKVMNQLGEAIEDHHDNAGLMDVLLLMRVQVEDNDFTELFVNEK